MSIAPVTSNPYIPPSADNQGPTARDENEAFKGDLRQDATELSKVEMEGAQKLALVDSTLGTLLNVTA